MVVTVNGYILAEDSLITVSDWTHCAYCLWSGLYLFGELINRFQWRREFDSVITDTMCPYAECLPSNKRAHREIECHTLFCLQIVSSYGRQFEVSSLQCCWIHKRAYVKCRTPNGVLQRQFKCTSAYNAFIVLVNCISWCLWTNTNTTKYCARKSNNVSQSYRNDSFETCQFPSEWEFII